ncbi:MAG TPA: MFS transporter [Stellaceae bacterium]|jgi:DHA2 family multidrug resistance protein-like MFS transporter|nr:MFS transporter [Stellaceae bacterium]
MNSAEDGLPVPQRYWAILTLMIGLAMSCLDTAIVNVALPTISRDLHIHPADAIWVINAYQLAVMVSLLSFASFGDIFGYRRVYRFGIVLYTGAAFISATAGSLEMLVLGRLLQGLGAAGLMSVNTALVRHTYPARQLGRGIAMASLVVATSSAAGPTVAAAILAVAPWPWLFAVNVPIGIVTFILSLRLLPYTPRSSHRFDLVSAGLCAAMFATLICGINGIGHGQAAAAVVAEFAAALGTGFLLVRRQLTLPMPLLPVDLFRRPIFALSVTTSVCSFVAQGIAFVSLPFYFHDALGASAVTTGLYMTPWAVMTAIMAPIAGRLADKHPAGILGGIGLAVLATGFVTLALIPEHPTTIEVLLRVALCGIGFGLFQSPNNRSIVASAPRERSGGAGAIQGTARLLGQSIGAALVALVFGFSGSGHGSATAILVAAGFAAIAMLTSVTRLFDAVRTPRPTAPPAGDGLRGPAE